MKITVARSAGFCMGVRRAVEIALDASNRSTDPIYTYGPLIHNPQVLELLENKVISVIHTIPEKGSGTVLIRAHGIPPRDRELLERAGFNVIDATCPRVIKVQSIIAKHARQGYAIIIIGDRDHPEVKGLMGYAGDMGHVAETREELEGLAEFESAIIVAQTTQNSAFFKGVKEWVRARHPHYRVFDTICDSTENRQADVTQLAREVDAMVVVGGRESGNTRRLYEIARQTGKPAVHIETEDELDLHQLGGARRIGITAGASTPNWIIKRVHRKLEDLMVIRGQRCKRWLYLFQRYLLLSNIYIAMGAGGLTYAATRLQGLSPSLLPVCLAVFYLLSMHTFNNLVDISSNRYNDPDKAQFYQQNRGWLAANMVLAGTAGVITAFLMGPLFAMLGVCMTFMGFIYIINLVPRRPGQVFHPKVRDIPGSKTVLAALAWGIVTSIVPAIHGFGQVQWVTVLVFLWTACFVFARTAFFDILDMQGSRIVGRETIPILLGEKKTLRLIKILLWMMAAMMAAASAAGVVSSLGLVLTLCPLSMILFLSTSERGLFSPGLRQAFLMESHFVLAGALALIWSLIR